VLFGVRACAEHHGADAECGWGAGDARVRNAVWRQRLRVSERGYS
jgi:hypothetical protein